MLGTHNSALTFELHCYPRFPLGARALIYIHRVCKGGKLEMQ